jgi:hypothetical protein
MTTDRPSIVPEMFWSDGPDATRRSPSSHGEAAVRRARTRILAHNFAGAEISVAIDCDPVRMAIPPSAPLSSQRSNLATGDYAGSVARRAKYLSIGGFR